NSTSTHDTKRGEDARMRINLLSQIPDRWKSLIKEWMKMNQPLKKTINGKTAPSVNDEYFLYQSLIGGFPQDLKVEESYIKRLQEYMVKVLREAKIESGWDEPNEEYEKACTEFIASILNKKHDFLDSLTKFLNEILDASSTYSLNQALIKITAPGIPDIYQGCELWDLSYVDPDNRRPVDYAMRQELLGKLIPSTGISQEKIIPDASTHRAEYLTRHRDEGIGKLQVVYQTLQARKKHKDVFIKGEYIPLYSSDNSSVLAFARRLEEKWFVTIAPLHVLGYIDLRNAMLKLPKGTPTAFTNLITSKQIETPNATIPLSEYLEKFPALLTN